MDPRAFRQWSPPTILGGRAIAGLLSKAEEKTSFSMPSVRTSAPVAMHGSSMPTVSAPKSSPAQPSLHKPSAPGSQMPTVSAPKGSGLVPKPSASQQKQQVRANRPVEKPGSKQTEMFAMHGAKQQAAAGKTGQHGQTEMSFGGAFESRSKKPPATPKFETIGQHEDRTAKENQAWDTKIKQAKAGAAQADARQKWEQGQRTQHQQGLKTAQDMSSTYAGAGSGGKKMMEAAGIAPRANTPSGRREPSKLQQAAGAVSNVANTLTSPVRGAVSKVVGGAKRAVQAVRGAGNPVGQETGSSGGGATVATRPASGPQSRIAGPNIAGNTGFGMAVGQTSGDVGGPAAATSMGYQRLAGAAHGITNAPSRQDAGRMQREAYQQRAEMVRRMPTPEATQSAIKALRVFNAMTPAVRAGTRTFQ